MNPISHPQAQHFIREQMDGRKLTEPSWNALQSHLETCVECRRYQAHFATAERDLRRSLHVRWDGVDGPTQASAPALASLQRERISLRSLGRKYLRWGGSFLALALLVVAWSAGLLDFLIPGRERPVVEMAPTNTPLPSPTPTTTPSPDDFRSVITYQSMQDGNAEVYLVNTGSQPVNLTANPSQDTQPAWSPDGDWIAFLSNRTGKREVYVMTVAGSRLTQVTSEPGIDWRGPISWSYDGKELALTGARTFGSGSTTREEIWIYRVPLGGQKPYTIGMTSGAQEAGFSPRYPLLAMNTKGFSAGALTILEIEKRTFNSIDNAVWAASDSTVQRRVAGPGENGQGSLSWSADGLRVLFIEEYPEATRDEAGNDVIARYEIRSVSLTGPEDSSYASSRGASTGEPGRFRSPSWTNIKDEIAYLEDPDGSGCWHLVVGWIGGGRQNRREVDDLCIDSGLERDNWRVTGKAVLVTGHAPGETVRGLYVVHLYDDDVRLERLADANNIVGTPRTRPTGDKIAGIDPVAARSQQTVESQPLPGPDTGDLLFVTEHGDRMYIERMAPDGSNRVLLNQSIGENACPRWSPDRTRIAFLSDRASKEPGLNEVFVMDASGLNARQLTTPVFPVRKMDNYSGMLSPRYGCPVWSPDGHFLASMVSTPEIELAIIPVDSGSAGPPTYLDLQDNDFSSEPVWTPDGKILGVSRMNNSGREMLVIDPTVTDPKQAMQPWLTLEDGQYVLALAIQPDGKSAALFAYKDIQGQTPTTALLSAAGPALSGSLPAQVLYRIPDYFYVNNSQMMRLLADGSLLFLAQHSPANPVKAEVLLFPPGGGEPQTLTTFSDTIYSADFSADGKWITAVTEAGLMVAYIFAPSQRNPVVILPDVLETIDW
jgi:Tol biopolymer transport system component